ncbi:hypothetical protein [Pandoraea oxalativorans]|uniref:Uncharacterized protein n=1 Tax=Pandoraea oxalativorans TaxID=573737 RepID=A0A0G3III0_9BURK|nr:hypothetical protein [Pandoraea oxalativorans]AKK24910.2 hypothetical protein MB84_27975 [Pandoraea oxalativorans]
MMGSSVPNLSVNCDDATPEKDTAVELHMALPIPYADLGKVRKWLGDGDGTSAEQYPAVKYPQHCEWLSDWPAASREPRA